jgi:sarcosine oxidase subunit alpha
MTGKPYRLASGGNRIDRSKPLSFSFDGRTVQGFAGDTVASAVLASGQRVFGRSYKYHRPRGVIGLGSEEMNALIGVGVGARHEPNLRATQIELFNGMTAVSQNRWPSLNFDIGAINNKLSRFFPGGFYYKTFMWPRAFWKHVYEPVIRHAAGLGKAPEDRDPDTYEHMHIHADVVVVGGGIAGLTAAEAAAAGGVRVLLIDENPVLGGIADLTAGKVGEGSVAGYAKAVADRLAALPNVQILSRTTAVGHFHHNYMMAFERVGDHDPSILAAGAPRHRLWKIRAGHILLASGALERPIAFANNDRPGITLASAVRGMVERYGVAPGTNGVVFTNNDDAYLTALALKKAGVNVQVVDSRARPQGELVQQAMAAGIEVSPSSVISKVDGNLGVKSVKIAAYRKGQGRVITEKKVDCDFIAMSGGWNPALHLWCHNGGKIRFDDGLASFRPNTHTDAITAIGAANGSMSVAETLAEALSAGEAAAKSVNARCAGGDLVCTGHGRLQRRQQALHRLPERRDRRRSRTGPARRL